LLLLQPRRGICSPAALQEFGDSQLDRAAVVARGQQAVIDQRAERGPADAGGLGDVVLANASDVHDGFEAQAHARTSLVCLGTTFSASTCLWRSGPCQAR